MSPELEHKPCQDCGQKVWRAGLLTYLGRIYLCAECADEFLDGRDSKRPAAVARQNRLLARAFGRAS